MAQWLVTQGNHQFPVEGLGDLEALARKGELKAGDMIQPPGATDWLYATEVPELKAIFASRAQDDDDGDDYGMARKAAGAAIAGVVALVLLGVVVVGGGAMFYLAQQLPGGDERLIGAGGLSFSEMIVTEQGTGLRSEPAEGARVTAPLKKDQVLELLAKRHEFYRARSQDGAEGWIPATHVIPMYQLGGADVREEYDPLYNPDRYVQVMNARWMQLPKKNATSAEDLSNVTNFEFMMSNESRYPMTDLVLLATIKDAKGHELETVEIPIGGVIPPMGKTMVGTLAAEEAKGDEPAPGQVLTTSSFDELSRQDPDLQLRWTSGVEVEMKTEAFTNAEIDILELRAVPDAAAVDQVRRKGR